MKTPEQIAAEATETIWQDFSGDFAEIQTTIAAAIKADREQRPEAATIASLRQEIQYLTTGEQS